jgi:uncharacterized protein YdhG (YjbR/CyaY superfamily)
MKTTHSTNIDEYISQFPVDVQSILEQIRKIVMKAIPTAEEVIKYDMPTYVLDGRNLVHFAAYKNHIGLYPAPAAEELKEKIKPFLSNKSTLKFPLDQPVPPDLIRKIVVALVKQRNESPAAMHKSTSSRK